MKTSSSFIALIGMTVLAIAPVTARAGSFSERRESAVAESSKAQSVPGAEKFSVPMPADKAFDAIVTALQKSDLEVSDAKKDAGFIATSIVVEGGWRQTGTRTVVTVIRDSDTSTIVKVVVTEQKRFKALQVEPWSDPKANAAKTAAATTALKQALGVK